MKWLAPPATLLCALALAASAFGYNGYAQAFQVCAEDPPNQVDLVVQFQPDIDVYARAWDQTNGYLGDETIPAGGNGLWLYTLEGPTAPAGRVVIHWRTPDRRTHGIKVKNYAAVDCGFG